ncbi:uncharacterized protein LOC114291656 isoform X1 [Camellia sinensis]|nr:uncharacterized protein LOC114291656 isoform X1 [Camellia sinensis]
MAAISHAIIPQLNLIDAQTSHLIHTQTSSPIRRCSHSHPNNQTSSPIPLLFTRRCWSPLTAAALLTVEKTGASSSSEALERRSVNLTPVQFLLQIEMVIRPPVKQERITKFLKPYILKMHFTNKFVSAQVIHSPTATVASAASSQEKALRSSMESTRDVAAAAKIGKILGERLLVNEIPAVSVFLKREQKYHGKVKAVIDSLKEAGIKLV